MEELDPCSAEIRDLRKTAEVVCSEAKAKEGEHSVTEEGAEGVKDGVGGDAENSDSKP